MHSSKSFASPLRCGSQIQRTVVFCWIVSLGLLSACTPTQTLKTDSGEQWQMSGKLGIWTAETKESAQMNWLQCGQNYQIRLSGPLGIGAVIIDGDKDEVTISQAGKDPWTEETPEDLMEKIGWNLPVSSLFHWLRMRPTPNEPFEEKRDTDERLVELSQQGWLVEYQRYQNSETGLLPALIQIKDADIRAKFIISDWDLSPSRCQN